jgi:cytochrome c oxidase subunit 2
MMLGLENLVSLATAESATFWMPEAGSNFAHEIDPIFYFIYWCCVVFFVAIVGSMVYFCVKYRRRSEDQKTSAIKDNHKLELAWAILPSFLLLAMFWVGFVGFIETSVPPGNSIQIRVTGQRWSWNFQYPGGFESSQLVVPVNQPVQLTMTSTDVLHSFFVPQLRVKRDLVPGRYTLVWFEALNETSRVDHASKAQLAALNRGEFGACSSDSDCIDGAQCYQVEQGGEIVNGCVPNLGECSADTDCTSGSQCYPEQQEDGTAINTCMSSNYILTCAEYCGRSHSMMRANVHVVDQAEWEGWLELRGGRSDDPLVRGAVAFSTLGCNQCHSIDAAHTGPSLGPDLWSIYGRNESFEDGSSLLLEGIDFDNYVRDSVQNPNGLIVEGFNPIMPTFRGRIDEEQLADLILFFRSLHE